jgi:hypothetical protein
MVAQSFSKFNTKSHQDILNIVIEKDMTEDNEISRIILDCAYKVHTK